MIVQRRISVIRNKITRNFVLHKNRKAKDEDAKILLIFLSLP